ncbi:hypothetical protein PoB_002665800 [Plakobranchus ocellatus]|uniref:Uncharacterized protein n=1 Tax=Plakobranchus ocellatus TaxID=259542 RepID=A0AAV4A0C5_9GAST|nr:hypothetical protein PoB_002665800 [Plakobranchus ocellatus]
MGKDEARSILVDRYTVEEAVWSAVSYLNDGFSCVEKVLLKLGVNVGAMSHRMCQAGDAQRQKDSARMSLDSNKKRRKTLRAKRKGFKDITRDEEGDVYSTGGHSINRPSCRTIFFTKETFSSHTTRDKRSSRSSPSPTSIQD